jgi:hypothetical protein
MNDYEHRNTLVKTLAVQTGLLLEHFQWGKQSVADDEVLQDLETLQSTLNALRDSLRSPLD